MFRILEGHFIDRNEEILAKENNLQQKESKMMKRLLVITAILLPISMFAQIQIKETDMPVSGLEYKSYSTSTINGNYNSAGANYSWDFRDLGVEGADTVKYLPMDSVPALLVTAFNLFAGANAANLAIFISDSGEENPLPIESGYNFYVNNSTGFKNLGFGIIASGFPVPIKYDNPDVIYQFPLDYQDTYSSQSYLELNLPNLFFYSSNIQRSSEVDGWGTIALPGDTFEVLRVKSTIIQKDSIYLDSLGTGFGIPEQFSTVYSWLAKNQGIPVLEVNESDFGTTATFTSVSTVNTPEINIPEEKMNVWVSAENEISLRLSTLGSVPVQVNLIDQLGRRVETLLPETQINGEYYFSKNIQGKNLKGVFYVQIIAGKQVLSKAIQF